jgi:hypothetical protein
MVTLGKRSNLIIDFWRLLENMLLHIQGSNSQNFEKQFGEIFFPFQLIVS